MVHSPTVDGDARLFRRACAPLREHRVPVDLGDRWPRRCAGIAGGKRSERRHERENGPKRGIEAGPRKEHCCKSNPRRALAGKPGGRARRQGQENKRTS